MFGTVTRYYDDKGYGFIRGEDGNTYFIHASNLYGEQIARGYYVHFKTFVTVLESDRNSHPKTSRINQSESDRNSQS